MAPWNPVGPGALLAFLVALVLLAGLVTVAAPPATSDAQRAPDELVEPKPGQNVIWGYTSAGETVHQRTLAINIVVHGDAEHVRYHLTERVDAAWNETDEEWEEINPDEGERAVVRQNATVIEWGQAQGAVRYVYVYDRQLTEERENETTRRPHQARAYFPEAHGEAGQWIEESYQLHQGEYFGARDHLRVYESPHESDDWVVIQAHSEHFDWFRLRHTVDGIEDSQRRLEAAFMGQPYVDDVWRMYLANDGSQDSDGWATVIELGDPPPGAPVASAGAVGVALGIARRRRARKWGHGHDGHGGRGLDGEGRFRWGADPPLVRRRLDRRLAEALGVTSHVDVGRSPGGLRARLVERVGPRRLLVGLRWVSYGFLFASLFVLYLSVRVSGILLELHGPALTPHVIAGLLYPLIAVGLPVSAWVFARRIAPVHSFVLAASGLGTAIVVDYLYIDIAVLPIDVVLHRAALAIAIGLVAAGATSRSSHVPPVNRWFGAGVVLWILLLVAPLVGWI